MAWNLATLFVCRFVRGRGASTAYEVAYFIYDTTEKG